jgi:hypothetical protein
MGEAQRFVAALSPGKLALPLCELFGIGELWIQGQLVEGDRVIADPHGAGVVDEVGDGGA